jgi:hypothetical protein
MASLIHFVCWVNHPEVRTARSGVVLRAHVTVHDGQWAYCSTGGRAGHVWEPIEPRDLTALKMYELHRRETGG